MRIPDSLTCFLRKLYTGQEAVRPGLEKQAGSIFGKESVKAVYCYPVYLTFMQSTSCEMPGWMKHKLESRFQGEISITSPQVFKWHHLYGWKLRGTKESFDEKRKEECEKAGLKLNIQKMKIIASSPITSWKIDGEKCKQWQALFSWAPKLLQMVTAAMKLKDTYSLEEKIWPSREHIKKQGQHFTDKGQSSQSYGFSSSYMWMWELDHKVEHWRTDAFELWCFKRLLRVPWTTRKSNQSILKDISPGNSLERLMLKL